MQVKGYLHNDEEVRLKTIIWTEMNKEYLEVRLHPNILLHATTSVPDKYRICGCLYILMCSPTQNLVGLLERHLSYPGTDLFVQV